MGPLIIISGPSGCGKSTLVERLLAQTNWPLHLAVSATTRPPRPGERDGTDYHFWTRERFDAELAADGFLEWAEVFGNRYGTLRREVEPYRARGEGVLLEIDVQGCRQVVRRCPDAVTIFVRTSTPEVLAERLRRRGTETAESLEQRLRGAAWELAHAHEYRHQVVNDDLESALKELRTILDPLFER
ncbi:MAG: guanylate kinase [Gemmataceae bacterium]|nr:guanylate kinase [Gemmataceae bacterium]